MCLRHSGIYRSILMNNLHTYIYKGLTQNEYSSGPHSHRQTHSCILTLHEILKLTLISKTLSQTKISIMYKVFRIEQVFPSTQIDSSSTLNIYTCFPIFCMENESYVIIILQQWKTYLIYEISILQIT